MEGSSSCTRYDMVLAVKVEPVEEHLSLDGTRIHESTWGNSYFTHFGNNWDHTYAKMESPPTARVKLEPATETSGSVKKETECADLDTEPSDSAGPRGVSEAAARAGLYTDHAVKDELVIGPERPHRPRIALRHDVAPGVSSWSLESARQPREDLVPRDCSVKLERCDPCVTTQDTATPPAEHIVAQTHDILPQNTYNTVPQTHDILPQTTHDTVPHSTDDPVPQNTHDSVPQAHDTFQHAATNTYVCDICGKRIKRKDHLIRHVNMHLRENSETLSNKLNIYERVRMSQNPCSCKICNKEFTRLDYLQRHGRVHTGEKPHSCAICKKQFAQKCNLTAHKRIHTGEKPYSCNICKKHFAESGTLKKHKRVHTGDYSCNICKMQFAESRTLKKHKRVHTGEKPYGCEVCSKVFAYFETLKRHELIHTGAKPYTCEICEERFMRVDTLKTHLISHMGNKSKAKEKKPHVAPGASCWSQESAREPCEELVPRDCSVKLGRCDPCVTTQETATPPAEHIVAQTHDTVTQNTHDSVPQTHDTFQHAATNTYVCDICGKRIKRKDHLIRHINMHLRENSETLSNKLNIYERVRTSQNPHSCKICNKEFTRLENLRRHERIHTGEKTHSCKICKKQFAHKCNLTAHKRIHTGEKPYSCNICKMQFAESGTLKKHKRVHTGEKSYACEVCSKVFAYFETLKRHKLIHTGAKPYTCEICEERFMRVDTLKTHLISHMGNKSNAKEKTPRKGKAKGTHDKYSLSHQVT